jgi:hypothetical protein
MLINDELEKHRRTNGGIPSKKGDPFGLFTFDLNEEHPMYHHNNGIVQLVVIIVSNDPKWQHASVGLLHRDPTWNEMNFVKEAFWGPDLTVVQFHPKKTEYINLHPHLLHLWIRTDYEYELPDLDRIFGKPE